MSELPSQFMPSPLYACIRMPHVPEFALDVAKDFSPRLQRYASGCVVLDVSGLGCLLGEPDVIGVEIERACAARWAERDRRPASVHVAVAPTQIAALLLAWAQGDDQLTVVTADVAPALSGVPLSILHQVLASEHGDTLLLRRAVWRRRRNVAVRHAEACDAYQRAFDVLRRWGLTTVGELAALPAGELSARLGQDGVALQRCARGVVAQPLVPDPEVPRFLQRLELEWPIDGLEPLSFVLARMLEPLSAALERADRGAAAIRLDLRLVDRTVHARMLQLPAAMRDPKVLRTLLVLDLESHPPAAAIDCIAIEVDPAPGRILQYSLLERARPSTETLTTLIARLGALVGESRCGAPTLLDTHQPDAFEMHRFAPDAPHPIGTPQSTMGEPHSAIATLQSALVLRRFRPPRAVRVSVERGRPARVAIDRRGMPGGAIEQCAGPWRSSGAWWAADRPWNRDEWDVSFSDGVVCRLFRERDTGHWFMEGMLD
jgi:protein ImuB